MIERAPTPQRLRADRPTAPRSCIKSSQPSFFHQPARAHYIALAAAVLAAGGVYYWGHPTTKGTATPANSEAHVDRNDQSQPVPDQRPTSEAEQQPKPISQTSSQEAVKRLQHAQNCLSFTNRLAYERAQSDCGLQPIPGPGSQERYAACLSESAAHQAESDRLVRDLRACSQEELSAHGLFEATLTAAEAGDDNARLCFVRGRFTEWQQRIPGQENLPQSDVDTYLQMAPKYVEDGLSRGDWAMVALLAARRPAPGDLVTQTDYAVGTASARYKYTKLLQMGANADYASVLVMMLGNIQQEHPTFSATDKATAEQSAKEIYNSHFAASPRLDAMPGVCQWTQ